MKKEDIKNFVNLFDKIKNEETSKDRNPVEFWLARDLQNLLGYTKWDNFLNAILKAKISCEGSKNKVSDHFADVGKTIQMPKGAENKAVDHFVDVNKKAGIGFHLCQGFGGQVACHPFKKGN